MFDHVLWLHFLSALALVLVIEGILPFLSPLRWKRLMHTVMQQKDKNIRIMGLVSMLVGLVLLYLLHANTALASFY